jgi:hypothetical protein
MSFDFDFYMPELRVLLYPREATPYKGRPGVVFVDSFGASMNLANGDTGSAEVNNPADINPTIGDSWAASFLNPNAYRLSNCDFVRFNKDGTFTEGASPSGDTTGDTAGFILRARIAPLDCKIGTVPGPNTAYTDLKWKVTSGEWAVAKSLNAPTRTVLTNVGEKALHQIRTIGNIAANRSLQWELDFESQLPEGPRPSFRLMWGGERYSILLRHGAVPQVEKKVGAKWQILRRLTGVRTSNLAGGHYLVGVRRIGGRMVISIDGYHCWFLDFQAFSDPTRQPLPVDVSWPEGPLSINCYNVRADVGVSLIKYADADDSAFTGTVKRTVPIRTTEVLKAFLAGWWRGGGRVTGTTTPGPKSLDYTINLTASPAGVDTPFVTQILGQGADRWVYQNAAPLDAAHCIMSGTVSLAAPGLVAGAEATMTFDREQLNELNPNWQNYAREYNVATIEARWVRRDGTTTNWYPLLAGYVHRVQRASAGLSARTLTLNFKDPIVRLQEPAAVVDHRYPPLDFVLLQNLTPTPGVAYGSDFVRFLLARALGTTEAGKLHVKMPASHYPLHSIANDRCGYVQVLRGLSGQPVTSGTTMFPAPHGQSVLSWIGDLQKKDGGTVFFYGWPNGHNGTWPIPCYGRERLFMQAANGIKTIYDTRLPNGVPAYVLLSSDSETRPDKDINRVLVWATNNMGVDLRGLLPALRMAEARLPSDDINSAEKSWERTYVIRDELAHIPGAAEARALLLIDMLRGRLRQWPRLTCRGDATLTWGSRVQVAPGTLLCPDSPDYTMAIYNTVFRVDRVEHSFVFGEKNDWTTTLQTHPENQYGL